jgi:hypothetical protein
MKKEISQVTTTLASLSRALPFLLCDDWRLDMDMSCLYHCSVGSCPSNMCYYLVELRTNNKRANIVVWFPWWSPKTVAMTMTTLLCRRLSRAQVYRTLTLLGNNNNLPKNALSMKRWETNELGYARLCSLTKRGTLEV